MFMCESVHAYDVSNVREARLQELDLESCYNSYLWLLFNCIELCFCHKRYRNTCIGYTLY